jgi:uncharacterized protein YehS (DUF1456 family)
MKWNNFDYFKEEEENGFQPRNKNKIKKMKDGKLDGKSRRGSDAKRGNGPKF